MRATEPSARNNIHGTGATPDDAPVWDDYESMKEHSIYDRVLVANIIKNLVGPMDREIWVNEDGYEHTV